MFAQYPRINRPAALAFLLLPFTLSAQEKTSGTAAPKVSHPGTVGTKPTTKEHPKNEKRTRVEINTTLGKMVVELYNETPQHRDNFIKLAKTHYYDSLLFHRVIPDFMIQGGDPKSKTAARDAMLGDGGPDYTIPAEFNKAFIHKKGALSAARQSDQVNPEKRSSGSQFYIVQGNTYQASDLQTLVQRKSEMAPGKDHSYTPEQIKEYATMGGTPHLDGDYTVFGEVVEGLDVIDRIAAVPCDGQDRPMTDVRMWIRILK